MFSSTKQCKACLSHLPCRADVLLIQQLLLLLVFWVSNSHTAGFKSAHQYTSLSSVFFCFLLFSSLSSVFFNKTMQPVLVYLTCSAVHQKLYCVKKKYCCHFIKYRNSSKMYQSVSLSDINQAQLKCIDPYPCEWHMFVCTLP